MAEILSDSRLQELVEQHNLSLDFSKDKKGFPIINVVLTAPTEELSNYDLVCDGCNKTAKAVLEEDIRNAWIGVKIRFQNLLKYRVEGCELQLLDKDQLREAQDDFLSDNETAGAKLLNSCIDGNYVPLRNQGIIVASIWSIVGEILREKDIKMRPERPPLVSKVRAALTVTK